MLEKDKKGLIYTTLQRNTGFSILALSLQKEEIKE